MNTSLHVSPGSLVMSGIYKSFAHVPALTDVEFTVNSGEIHALLGANGAGKSTLMKILSGAYTSDQGHIVINGQQVHIDSPAAAKQAGIQCVCRREYFAQSSDFFSRQSNSTLEIYLSASGSDFAEIRICYFRSPTSQ